MKKPSPKLYYRKATRSLAGSAALLLIMGLVAVAMAAPLVLIVSNAFKPLDELLVFPPRLFPRNWTLSNFSDLVSVLETSWVPVSRYAANTVFLTVAGTAGHVLVASMAAYPLAKNQFPGKNWLFALVVMALMFSARVTATPNYIIVSSLGMVNSYWAVVLPVLSSSLGLYLMKQFMEQIPDGLLEAARIEGASEYQILWRIVMPNVKPAWLTLIILMFQQLWSMDVSFYIRSEELKTLNHALNTLAAGGIARSGVASAVGLVMISVPILLFIFNQSRMIETMTNSGMKD